MKYWALKFATDAAVTVLRVDQVRKKARSPLGFIFTTETSIRTACIRKIKVRVGKEIQSRLKCRPTSQNFTVALEASLLGQLFIFRTIFQPWALSSDIPAA